MLVNLILIFALLGPIGGGNFSGQHFFNIVESENSSVPERINPENLGVKVSADRYVAIDVRSGKILLQKQADAKQPIASITKLMTALVLLDQKPKWDSFVEMKQTDETFGAQPHLYRGEIVKFADLWESALISSDNNAIKAMIRSLNFPDENFIKLMNDKARELEMNNTTFSDPTGLNVNNISTAQDVARLIHAAMQKQEIQQTVLQEQAQFIVSNTGKKRVINNTDILLNSFLNQKKYGYQLVGGKTGYLPEAGYCLGAEIIKDNVPVIIVALNSEDIWARFQSVKVIADWVFSNYTWGKR